MDYYRQLVLEAQKGGLGDLGKALLLLDQAGIRLEDFENILVLNPQNGEVLKYDAATGKWKNGVPTTSDLSYQPVHTTLTGLTLMPTGVGFPYQLALDVFSKIQFGTGPNQVAQGNHVHTGQYATTSHFHDETYAPLSHNHDTYYISVITSPIAGNIPVMDATGELNASAFSADSFVKTNLPITSANSITVTGTLSSSLTFALVNDTATPGNNKVYGTNGAGAKGWKDDPLGSGTAVLDSLTDVVITSPVSGQVLKYDFVNNQWINGVVDTGEGTFQPVDNTLSALAALDASVGVLYQSAADTFAKRAIGTAANTVAAGDHTHAIYQPISSTLTTFATLTGSANSVPYFTGASTISTFIASAYTRGLMPGADAATWRTGLELGTMAVKSAISLGTDVTGNLAPANLASGTNADNTTYWRGDGSWAVPVGTGEGGTSYTDEQAQDAVGIILVDTASIDLTYTDATPSITAALIGDTASPGNYKHYGTNASGVRGWQTGWFSEIATTANIRTGAANKIVSSSGLFASREPVALTVSAGTTAVDFSTGLNFSLTLTANTNILNPTSVKFQDGVIRILQDATGGRTVTWGSDWKFESDIVPIIPTGPNAWTIVPYYVFNATTVICGVVNASTQATSALITVTETGTSRTNTSSDKSNWVRWTSASTKTFTIVNTIANAGDVWSGINANTSGTLSIVAGDGMTLTGMLSFLPRKSYSIRFVSASVADVIGGT